MLDYFLLKLPGAQPYELSGDEAAMAESLAETKYKTWEWNWAYGPEYHFRNTFGISGVEHECRMYVKDGIIRECSITGSSQMNIFSGRLTGCRHMVDDLSDLFRKEGIILGEEEIYGFF